jgi:hypothetical protein
MNLSASGRNHLIDIIQDSKWDEAEHWCSAPSVFLNNLLCGRY